MILLNQIMRVFVLVYSENSKDCQVTDKSNSAENVFSSKHEQVEFAFGKGTKEEINDEREMEEDGKAKKSQDGPDLERKLRRERVPKPGKYMTHKRS